MSQTPDADVILPSGAKSDSCSGEDEGSDSRLELEGCYSEGEGSDSRLESEGCFGEDEDQDSDCSGCSTATVSSAPRLALEAAAAAAWEAKYTLPPAPSPFDSGMEEELDSEVEVEFLGTSAAPLKEPLAIKENKDLEHDAAEKPIWNFTAVENNLGLDAHGQPITEVHERRYLQRQRAHARNERLHLNETAGLDRVALLCGLDPREVAAREVAEAEAEAAAAAAEGAAAVK
jgi:hypothetical protein